MFSLNSRLSLALAATVVAICAVHPAIAQPAADYSIPVDAAIANAKITVSKSTKSQIAPRRSVKPKAATPNRNQPSNRDVTDDYEAAAATARGTATFTAPDRAKSKYENYSAVNQLID